MLISDPKMTEEDVQKALAAQLAAWAYESHAWKVEDPAGVGSNAQCLWCGKERVVPDKLFADELCPKNPLILKLNSGAKEGAKDAV